MISDFVNMVNSLRASNSTNHKKSVLEQYRDSKVVRELLFLAYNPYLNYYITKPEVYVGNSPISMGEDAYKAFKSLLVTANTRTITPAQFQSQLQALLGQYSSQVVECLLLVVKRDIKCGVNVSTINAVMGNFIPDFKVMLAEKVDNKVKPRFPCWGSPKLDGYRAPSFKVNNQRGLYSREGRYFDSYSYKLAEPLEKVNEQLRIRFSEGAENVIFDGECMAADYAETSSARAKDSKHALVYHMFDCLLGWEEHDFDNRTATERYMFLEIEVQEAIDRAGVGDQIKVVKHTIIKDETEMVAFFEKCVAEGYEGAMFTNVESAYERDRVRNLLKMKPVRKTTVDCEIIEVLPGKPGTKYEHTMGSIVVRGTDENGVSFQANCGSGITDAFRKEWQGRWSELLGHIAELNYDCITQDKDTGLFSLRFPRMRGLRFDKTKV